MAIVLVGETGTKIGAYNFTDRKRPAICVENGNTITVYGYFKNEDAANTFMHELALLIGAKED